MFQVRMMFLVSMLAALVVAGVGPAAAQLQSRDQQACLSTVAKSAAKLSLTQAKAYATCLKAAAGADLGTCAKAQDCVDVDPSGKIAIAVGMLRDADTKACTVAPDFGHRPAPLVAMVAVQESLGLEDDLLGADLDAAAVLKASQARGAACQSKILGTAGKLLATLGATYDSCKKAGLAAGSIISTAGLDACLGRFDSDPSGKIAKARSALAAVATATCRDLDLGALFPGNCSGAADFAACAATRARCRACRRAVSSDNLASDCELLDDGLANNSCSGHAGRCNGRAELCDRTFDAVSYPTTHNSFSNAEENWTNPNQRYGITRQLSDGVRALMLDTYYYAGDLYLCHAFCNMGEGPGKTPRELVTLARELGYDEPSTKAGVIVDWLKRDFDLGRGHAMALVQVIKNGASIGSKHVGGDGVHRGDSA